MQCCRPQVARACDKVHLLIQIQILRALRFVGRYVKEADKDIIKHLRSMGRLIDSSNYTHSYPFCWRSDTPLIQRVCLLSRALLAGHATVIFESLHKPPISSL